MSSKNSDKFQTGGAIYQITIRGTVHKRWLDCLDGVEITPSRGPEGKPVTVLKGIIADQSELRGLLTRLWDFNAVVIAFHQSSEGFPNLENSKNGEKNL